MSIAPDHTSPSVTDPANLISPVLAEDDNTTIREGAHKIFSFAAAAWLSVLAIPLVAFPRLLSLVFAAVLTSDPIEGKTTTTTIRELNELERSMAGLAGASMLAFATLLVIQTGAIPLTSSISSPSADANAKTAAPFRSPTITIATAFFAVIAYKTYDLGFWLIYSPSGLLAVLGLWALLFQNEGRVNKAAPKSEDFNTVKNKMDKKDLVSTNKIFTPNLARKLTDSLNVQ